MVKMPMVPSSPRLRFKYKEPSDEHAFSGSPLSEHSRRVKILRTFLPLLGFFLLVMIIAWPLGKQLYEKQFEDVSIVSKKLTLEDRLINPQLVDTDEKDHPFVLSAESSVQNQETQSELEKPRGEIKTDQGTDVSITADKGNFDIEAGILFYKDNVILSTSDGYTFKTRQAQLHVKTHIAEGKDPVVGNGPTGEIEAEGFRLDGNEKILHFRGKTRLILLDQKKRVP